MVEKIIEIVKSACKIIQNADDDLGIKDKGSNVNLVTKYDEMVQSFLFSELSVLTPECSFLGEEGENNKTLQDGLCYIIDPIDGTTNFIKGFRHSAVSVALAKDKELICGVVANPFTNEIFYAERGCGAFLNGKKIHASDCTLENSLVMFGTSPYEHEFSEKTFELARKAFLNSIEVRRSGCAALDICYVASGRADLYYEMILRPWDFAAGTLILREAGGICCTLEKEDINPGKVSSYLCANKNNINEFFKLLEN